MTVRKANAVWKGDLKGGSGTMALGSGAYEGAYTFRSRFEEGEGTNPEELIAAAHAGCFSMAFSNILAEAGHGPETVRTSAGVHLVMGDDGPSINRIDLHCEAVVPGLAEAEFQRLAETAKDGCPVSMLLQGAEIRLDASLK